MWGLVQHTLLGIVVGFMWGLGQHTLLGIVVGLLKYVGPQQTSLGIVVGLCGVSDNTLYWVLLFGLSGPWDTHYWVLLLVYVGPQATHFTRSDVGLQQWS
jgi:hypothetical protein